MLCEMNFRQHSALNYHSHSGSEWQQEAMACASQSRFVGTTIMLQRDVGAALRPLYAAAPPGKWSLD